MLGNVDDATTGARSVTEDIGDLVDFDALLSATFLHCFFPVDACGHSAEQQGFALRAYRRLPVRIRGARHQIV